MQEQEAIRRCQAGEIAGLGALFELYERSVFQTAYGIVRRYDMAEDVTQQVFIRLFDAVKRYDNDRAFAPWLHRIAVNMSLDELRRRKKRDLPLDDAGDLHSKETPPEEAAERNELREMIWECIGMLSPKHRAAVVLRYFHGFNEEEMATALGCRKGTVKSRLHNALKRLREVIAGPDQDNQAVALSAFVRRWSPVGRTQTEVEQGPEVKP